MNLKMISYMLGRVILIIGAFLLIPLVVSIVNADGAFLGFLVPVTLMTGLGLAGIFLKPKNLRMNISAGFVTVALAWVLLSFFGSLPFFISGAIPNFLDSLFESVSGFTTTGASVIPDVEILPVSILLWRSFTHWIGGLGVLVFVLAVLPKSESGAVHIFRAETTGPKAGKLTSKLKVTARILYLMHIALTTVELIALLIAGMSFFDALTTAFSTAGTGGFALKNASIGAYGSLPIEIVVMVFMFIFSINYNLFFLILIGRAKEVLKSEEFKTYLVILFISVAAIAVNILSVYDNFWTALRYSSFQVFSISSTTGFATADYTLWPSFAQSVLVILMLLGATAGSTGGGFKVSRFLILVKSFFRNLQRTIRPRSVKTLKFDGEPMESSVVDSVHSFFMAYTLLLVGGSLLISLNGTFSADFATSITAAISCLSNVGPGLARIGPAFTFAEFSGFTKVVMSLLMLAGRLEIFPILFLFYPKTWNKTF